MTAAELVRHIGGRKADDIRRSISDLIVSGSLNPGTRLPTIRAVAAELSTSVGAVADAWAELRRIGLLETRRRGGTTVAAPPTLAPSAARSTLDLRRAESDPAVLPDLAEPLVSALAAIASRPAADGPASPRLNLGRLAPEHDLLVLPGVHVAMHLALSVLVSPGDTVAIEDPTCIRNPKIISSLGARTIPLHSDEEGPLTASVATALELSPNVVTFQTAAAVPLGSSLSERRRDEIASLLESADPGIRILEEDPAGPLGRGASLSDRLPDRVVRVTDFSRAYGSALQTAVVTGPSGVLLRLEDARARIGIKSNPLLLGALSQLLTDPAASALVARAAEVYERRNRALLDALAERGVAALGRGGYFAWIPVLDERDALLALAERGISASPGSRSTVEPAAPHVRVATTRVPDDPARIAELADAIAAAATHTFAAEDE